MSDDTRAMSEPLPDEPPPMEFEESVHLIKNYRSHVYEGHLESAKSLWLISFTDLIGVMLAFFLLLYSMSSPREEKWKEVSTSLEESVNDKGDYKGSEWNAGSDETVALQNLSLGKALNTNYLRTVLNDLIKQDKRLDKVILRQKKGELSLILPEDIIFEQDPAKISENGEIALSALADLLARIDNRVEIVANVDEAHTQKGGAAWQSALERAARIAVALDGEGYAKPVSVEAAYQPYAESPAETSIIIAPDDGSQVQAVQIDKGAAP